MKINPVADLEALRAAGQSSLYPDRLKITVGTATCGLAAGADAVYEALQQRIEQRGLDEILARMKARLEAHYAEDLGTNTHLVSEIRVVSGHSAEMIMQQAESLDIDLIVVGTHTDTRLGHRLLGSTSGVNLQGFRVAVGGEKIICK